MSSLPSSNKPPETNRVPTIDNDKQAELYEAVGRAFFKAMGDTTSDDLPALNLTEEELEEAELTGKQSADLLRAIFKPNKPRLATDRRQSS